MVAHLLAPQLPLELAVQVVRAVADGLAYAHQARDFEGHPLNIVHRDVNPSNVLVSVNGTVKLVDFGIARATTTRRGDQGGFVGTFHSMSPEQARGKPWTRAPTSSPSGPCCTSW
ncbi:MAG: protein kinase [bacterium]